MATVDQFMQHLMESGLFSDQDLRALSDRIAATDGTQDAKDLASELIEKKQLTSYQANAIYQGHPQRLVIGRNYIIEDLIGSGGMGMVFRARHRRMRRTVALKVLTSQAMNDDEAIQRFYQEVEVAATLDHPNIVRAFDADESRGIHYLVMEYVRGNDLQQIVQREGPLAVGQAVNCIIQAAQGLSSAHDQRVIHRDIKPANLLLNSDGVVKILDMGLARINNPLGDNDGPHKGLTLPGSIMGTVDFMGPEQAADTTKADARSDIYSLGCTLFYILAGNPIYDGSTAMVKLIAHRESSIPSLCQLRDDASPELNAVFQRMVAKKPDDRYQTMQDVILALTPCRTESEAQTRETVTQFLSPEIRGSILDGVYNTSTGKKSNTKIQKPGDSLHDDSDADPSHLHSAPLPPSELDMKSKTKNPNSLLSQMERELYGEDDETPETVDAPSPLHPANAPGGAEKSKTPAVAEKPVRRPGVPLENSINATRSQVVPVPQPKGQGGQMFFLLLTLVVVLGGGLAVLYLQTTHMLLALFALAAFLVLVLLFRTPPSQYPAHTHAVHARANHGSMDSIPPSASGQPRPEMPPMKLPEDEEEAPAEADDKHSDEHTDESEETLDAKHIIGRRELMESLQESFDADDDYENDRASYRSISSTNSVTLRRLLESNPKDVPKRMIAPFDEWEVARQRKHWAEFLGIPGEMMNSVGTRMLLIPTGEFLMGSPQMEQGHVADEKQHPVRITRPYLLASHPVTVAEFQKFVNDTGYKTEAEKDPKGGFGFEGSKGKIEQHKNFSWKHPGFDQTGSHPVVNINWNDARAFCEWMSKRERITYRLPTEAEWEFACRAGTESRYYCGDDPESLVKYGNVADGSTKAKFPQWPTITSYGGYIFTAPVESFAANSFGLHDMHGNVWEWCADRYGKDYYQESALKDPEGPAQGSKRVLRGGSWMNAPLLTRSAKRLNQQPNQFFLANGFRLAATP